MAKKISTAQIYLSHLPSFLHLCIWEELIVVHLTGICRNNYDVACPMNFKNYPYDTQICKVKYESCKFPNSHSSNFDNLATFNTYNCHNLSTWLSPLVLFIRSCQQLPPHMLLMIWYAICRQANYSSISPAFLSDGYTTHKMLLKWKKGFDHSKVSLYSARMHNF